MKTLILVISMLAMPVVAANTNKSTDVISNLRPTISKVAKENGIDPVLMEAIMRHESGHGSSYSARNRNNLAGIMGRKGQRVYASKEACVEHLGSILAKYKARGRVTTAQIGKIYCKPTGKWVSNVNSQMKNIRSGRHGDISIYTKK